MSQAELLRFLLSVLGELGISHMLVGSHASSFYGEARSTHVAYLRRQAEQMGILSQLNEYLDATGET